ncbi:MAG: hypothetical protein WBN41_00715 [Lysobacterales bacterium]
MERPESAELEGRLGDKWAGRPFEAIQGRMPCMAGPVKTGQM